jgi:hypothetical protein|tara:strand:- start:358 stop:615 length:258 start_codon:yes stop_codon:yes gene_type:complete
MMSEDNTYNGWHNYATWRVSLEIFDGMEIDEPWSWERCRDYAEEILENESDGSNTLVLSYAFAFINDVAWGEISKYLNERLEGCI